MNILTKIGYKNIDDCVIGEEILAYEVGTGIEIINTIIKIEKLYPDLFTTGEFVDSLSDELDEEGNPIYIQDPIYEPFTWYLINGTYKIFKYQSIWTSPTSVKHGFQLEVGDVIYSDVDEDIIVTSIEVTDPDEFWYRLEISGDHSFIADGITLHNASRYWVSGGNGNWNSTTNWSSTSGGSSGSSIPTSVDDVFFDALGNSNSTVSATITVGNITVSSGYTAKMTFNALVTCVTNVVLGANMTVASNATGGIFKSTSGSITSNGCFFNATLSAGTLTATITIVDELTVKTLNAGNNSNQQSFNGARINFSNSTGTNIYGSSILRIVGSGTITGVTIHNSLLQIDTGVSITNIINVTKNGGTVQYISGNVNAKGIFTFNACTIDTSSVSWFNVGFAGTCTLTSQFNISNDLLITNQITAVNINGAGFLTSIGRDFTITNGAPGPTTINLPNSITVGRNLSHIGTNGVTINNHTLFVTSSFSVSNDENFGGTTAIDMNGTGNLSLVQTTTALNSSLMLSGNITVTRNVRFGTRTFTETIGSNVNWGIYDLVVVSTCSLDFNSNVIHGLNLANTTAATITLLSDLIISNDFIANTVTSALRPTVTAASSRKLTLQQGGTQDLGFTNFTNIDAGDGKTLWVWKPVLTNTVNINTLLPPRTVKSVFIS